eukprot:TRINITY_DN520_c0_g1_i3.p1 TRINITY_DN520_c0_g1~~TRINITY_DN520_c0_g1_i3.p1  ORF type:complete len:531 (+),score=102.01 TRINITY_DN520_c0_g1_i3:60-1652(+)
MRSSLLVVVVVVAAWLLCSQHVLADPCYVSVSGTNSPTCGSSAQEACLTIDSCLGMTLPEDGYDIMILPGTYSGTGNCNLTLSKPTQITGAGENQVIIDCGGSARHVVVEDVAQTFLLKQLTLANGKSEDSGGCLNVASTFLAIEAVTFQGCNGGQGGALFIDPSVHNAYIKLSNFTGNIAFTGGAIYWDYGPIVEINNCVFVSNEAYQTGGALVYSGGSVWDTIFEKNDADSGGAVYSQHHGTETGFTDCTFIGNTAISGGGALYITVMDGTFTIQDSQFSSNFVYSLGGALYIVSEADYNGTIELTRVSIRNNHADFAAGGVYLDAAHHQTESMTWTGTVIQDNVVGTSDGAAASAAGLVVVIGDYVEKDFQISGLLTKSQNNDFICLNSTTQEETNAIPFCAPTPCTVSSCDLCPGTCASRIAKKQAPSGQVLCLSVISSPCSNGGDCSLKVSDGNATTATPTCTCTKGWRGDNCDAKIHIVCELIGGNCWNILPIVGAILIVIVVSIIIIVVVRRRRHRGYITVPL